MSDISENSILPESDEIKHITADLTNHVKLLWHDLYNMGTISGLAEFSEVSNTVTRQIIDNKSIETATKSTTVSKVWLIADQNKLGGWENYTGNGNFPPCYDTFDNENYRKCTYDKKKKSWMINIPRTFNMYKLHDGEIASLEKEHHRYNHEIGYDREHDPVLYKSSFAGNQTMMFIPDLELAIDFNNKEIFSQITSDKITNYEISRIIQRE
jgi:hypothetical protein